MEPLRANKLSVRTLITLIVPLIGFGIGATFFLPPYLRDANERRLQAEGVAAEARVVGYRDRGNYFNYFNYGLEFFAIVEVQVPGGAPYRAEISSSGGEYLPGALVPVLVDSKDPQNVIFK